MDIAQAAIVVVLAVALMPLLKLFSPLSKQIETTGELLDRRRSGKG